MNTQSVLSVLEDAGIVAVGAVLTYLSQAVSGADFGSYGVLIAGALSVVTSAFKAWATSQGVTTNG